MHKNILNHQFLRYIVGILVTRSEYVLKGTMQANDIVLNEVKRKSKELTRRKKRSYQLKAALENSDKSISKEETRSVQQRLIDRHRLRRKKKRRTLRNNADHAEAVLLWAAVGRTNRLCQTKTKETAKLSLAPNDAVASYGPVSYTHLTLPTIYSV